MNSFLSVSAAVIVYRAKAPVCLCKNRPCRLGVDMCAPQSMALKATRYLKEAGYVFPEHLDIALSHSWTGEGRQEFDSLWSNT